MSPYIKNVNYYYTTSVCQCDLNRYFLGFTISLVNLYQVYKTKIISHELTVISFPNKLKYYQTHNNISRYTVL